MPPVSSPVHCIYFGKMAFERAARTHDEMHDDRDEQEYRQKDSDEGQRRFAGVSASHSIVSYTRNTGHFGLETVGVGQIRHWLYKNDTIAGSVSRGQCKSVVVSGIAVDVRHAKR